MTSKVNYYHVGRGEWIPGPEGPLVVLDSVVSHDPGVMVESSHAQTGIQRWHVGQLHNFREDHNLKALTALLKDLEPQGDENPQVLLDPSTVLPKLPKLPLYDEGEDG